jgi:exodeoxyribonuclease-3
VDTFRTLRPEEVRYTWWSHWGHARENNVGWRIDYFFVSEALRNRLMNAEIYENVMGSDHCPIELEIR